MSVTRFVRAALTTTAALGLAVGVMQAQPAAQRGGQAQAPAPPQGPLAPEKYKNIQVLTSVPADQFDLTMRFVSAAVDMPCSSCHVRDDATGEWQYDKDDRRSKQTARNMMKMVLAVNANARDYGLNSINCATCHQGHNQPQGLQLAQMATPEEIARAQAIAAARQGGQGGRGGAPGQGRGGRGQQPPAPPVDDVLNKYIDAIGGRAALEKLQTLVESGTMTNRMNEKASFTIESKAPGKFRVTLPSMTAGFDGSTGWQQADNRVDDLAGFPLDQASRIADPTLALRIKDRFPTLQASGRPARIDDKTATLVQGRDGNLIEQFYFDTDTGLLLRRRITTRTPLGPLTEQVDYGDYRDVAGVKLPFRITYNTWNQFDTYAVVDVKPNAQIADARFARPKG